MSASIITEDDKEGIKALLMKAKARRGLFKINSSSKRPLTFLASLPEKFIYPLWTEVQWDS